MIWCNTIIKFYAKAFPLKDGKEYVVEFDFLGKDSIRYHALSCLIHAWLGEVPNAAHMNVM